MHAWDSSKGATRRNLHTVPKNEMIHEDGYGPMIARPFSRSIWLQHFMGPSSEHGVHASAMQVMQVRYGLYRSAAAALYLLALSKARRNDSCAEFEVTREPRDETSVCATDARQKCSRQKDRKSLSYGGPSFVYYP